ncbi:vWA domain-containing protein [Terasakiella pusilla]|uniref:vWA domain-containing protein n=1 Tax=Terasakiella pusilla TaxID=64973 RepID=UPI000AB2EDEB|nr:vWA domain-containing protein [Terasakiella pusilla]
MQRVSCFVARFKCRFLLVLMLAVAANIMLPQVGAAQSRTPLLMDGKKTLYQRVLTRPGAKVSFKTERGAGIDQAAMTVLYVYGRKTVDGEEWLEVGSNTRGQVEGWIPSVDTLMWKQQLTLAFTNPAGRERALMFASRDDLLGVVQDFDPAQAVKPLLEAAKAGQQNDRIVSIEPENFIDISKQFYLLPILDVEETYTGSGYSVRALNIASVTKGNTGLAGQKTEEKPENNEMMLRNFKASVVFVVDSTISMGPYIERTREAVKKVYQVIEREGMADHVRFGLVAYRSSLEASPGLEYVSRVFVDPSDVKGGDDFLNKVKDLKPATVSSKRFDEDAYTGVMSALETVKWNEFGGRYLVLITDAGALKGGDELSGTGLDASQVRLEAQERGVALYALHLKTPQGKKNHASAQAQYEDLSTFQGIPKPLYYGVETGDVKQFGDIIDQLGMSIVANVRGAMSGEEVVGSARSAPDEKKVSETQAEKAAQSAEAVGHAMRLAYLGRIQGTQAPDLFSAWVSDRDLIKPDLATTDVRILLTKNQLSDMQQVMKEILTAGQMSQLSPEGFFDSMRSAAAVMGRDPSQVNNPDATKLVELGLMGEYLDDLPYKSKVMSMDQELWASWSIGEQQAFLDEVERKIRLYQRYHDDVARWVFLDQGADPGDAVYPVPLEALP